MKNINYSQTWEINAFQLPHLGAVGGIEIENAKIENFSGCEGSYLVDEGTIQLKIYLILNPNELEFPDLTLAIHNISSLDFNSNEPIISESLFISDFDFIECNQGCNYLYYEKTFDIIVDCNFSEISLKACLLGTLDQDFLLSEQCLNECDLGIPHSHEPHNCSELININYCCIGSKSLINNRVASKFNLDYTLYPNPNQGSFFIKVPKETTVNLITLYNSKGEHIDFISSFIEEKCHINILQYSSGIYFLKIESEKVSNVYKFVLE